MREPIERGLSKQGPAEVGDTQNQLRHLLRDILERELRELGERLRRDAREELRRLVDGHEQRLQQYLERTPSKAKVAGVAWADEHGKAAARKLGPPRASQLEDNRTRMQGGKLRSTAASQLEDKEPHQNAVESHPPGYVEVLDLEEVEAPHSSFNSRTASVIAPRHTQVVGVPSHVVPECMHSAATYNSEDSELGNRETSDLGCKTNFVSNHRLPEFSTKKKLASGMRRTKLFKLGGVAAKSRGTLGGTDHMVYSWAADVVCSDAFDYCIGALLAIAAILTGVQADYMARNVSDSVPTSFRAIDVSFCVLFTAELALRIYVWRGEFLRMADWRWNIFDSAVVFTTLLDEVIKLYDVDASAIDTLGVLRLLRFGRVLRLVRMVRLVHELKSMVYLIMASLKSFFWALVLMMGLVYCFGIYFTEYVTDVVRTAAVQDMGDISVHWGSLGNSILSLYMAISGGDDWRIFVEVFKADGAWGWYVVNTIVFSCYIAFGMLVMLNLVTGVFVEGAQRIIREERDQEQRKLAHRLMLKMADNRVSKMGTAHGRCQSVCVSWEAFCTQSSREILEEFCAAVGFNADDADRLFGILDEDDSGTIDLEEFVAGSLRLPHVATVADVAKLQYSFKTANIEMRTVLNSLELMLERVQAATVTDSSEGADGTKVSSIQPRKEDPLE